jgi:hypothetical protein
MISCTAVLCTCEWIEAPLFSAPDGALDNAGQPTTWVIELINEKDGTERGHGIGLAQTSVIQRWSHRRVL